MKKQKTPLIWPLAGKAVGLRDEADTHSTGGIFLPEATREHPLKGTLIAVGLGAMKGDGTRESVDIRIDDRVLFSRYGATDIILEGQPMTVIPFDNILAVLEDEAS